jgi:hypothetical protein
MAGCHTDDGADTSPATLRTTAGFSAIETITGICECHLPETASFLAR